MNIDFTPLFRSAIGFDRLARTLESEVSHGAGYPPYNIERTGENSYRLTVAVAGFRPEELDLQLKENSLVLTGRPAEPAAETQFLHRGIAGRAFERRFVLAEHMQVENASLRDGLLSIDVKRLVPEALQPRAIEIKKTLDA
jgi:molecular chaperone IbpA